MCWFFHPRRRAKPCQRFHKTCSESEAKEEQADEPSYDTVGPTYDAEPHEDHRYDDDDGWFVADPHGRGWYWQHPDGRTAAADGDAADGDAADGGDGDGGDGATDDARPHAADGGDGAADARPHGDAADGDAPHDGGDGDGADGDDGNGDGWKGHGKGRKGKGKGKRGKGRGKGRYGKGKGKSKSQATSRDGSGYYVSGGFVTANDNVFHSCLGYFKTYPLGVAGVV